MLSKKLFQSFKNNLFQKLKFYVNHFSQKKFVSTLSIKKKLGQDVKKITNFIQYSDGNNSLEKFLKLLILTLQK